MLTTSIRFDDCRVDIDLDTDDEISGVYSADDLSSLLDAVQARIFANTLMAGAELGLTDEQRGKLSWLLYQRATWRRLIQEPAIEKLNRLAEGAA